MYHTCIRTPFVPPLLLSFLPPFRPHPHIRGEGRNIQSSISGKLEGQGEGCLSFIPMGEIPRSRGVRVSYQTNIHNSQPIHIPIFVGSSVRPSAPPILSNERSSRSHIDQTLTGNTAYFPLQHALTPAIRGRRNQGRHAMLYIICVYLLTLKRPASKSVGAFPRFTFYYISCLLGISFLFLLFVISPTNKHLERLSALSSPPWEGGPKK